MIGVLPNALWTLPILADGRNGDIFGLLAALASATLAFWAMRTMLRAGERPDPGAPTKAIVDQGPFARTRNPIYISFALFDIGVALLLNNLWIILALAIFMVYVDIGIVRREERYLEQQLGDEYLKYKRSVRRWI
ncbi:MAG: methyltransferase family protein [Anaerolineales bacterium]